jgi:hypothetical protein
MPCGNYVIQINNCVTLSIQEWLRGKQRDLEARRFVHALLAVTALREEG